MITKNVPPLIEQLTNHFYEWEQRGRGWNVWDILIELEPAFVPFYYHLPPVLTQFDDGRKPTFLSALAEKLKKKNHNSSGSNGGGSLSLDSSFEEVAPQPFEDSGEIVEIRVILPRDYKIVAEYVEHCLLNITMVSSTLSFEIFGWHDSITIQFACRETFTSFIEQEIKAYFPECIIGKSENSLIQLLSGNEEKAVVVDFGLSEEFMRPIRMFDSFDPDPLTGIFGVFDNLEEGDTALVQVLFKAAEAPWAENIIRSVTDYDGDPFFMDAPEMVKLAHNKCKYPLFAVNLRAVGNGATEQQSWDIVRSLASCLHVFADPQSNELIPLINDGYDQSAHLEDVVCRQTHRSGMILNLAELLSLVHFPSQSVISKKLRNQIQKSNEAPRSVIGNEFILGENTHQGKTVAVSLNYEQRLRHMHVIGATGTGKSTLLLNLIVQDIEQGLGIALIDPHGDLLDSVLEQIPQDRYEDVVLFDAGDEERPIGFNILEAKSEVEKNVLSSDLVEIFKRFSTSWGDQMSVVLGNAISALLESEKKGSLVDLRKFLIEKEYRDEVLRYVEDENIKYFWEKEFNLLKRTGLGSILTRLDFFLRSKLIRNIIGQREGINLEDIINNKKILLIKLSQGVIGDENAYLLGSLLVSKLHQVVMQRQLKSNNERNPFYLYIDEFQNFITPSMKSILSGARKYHLGLILAHQDLHQLWETDTALANSLITNAGVRVCFRIGDFDAQKLQGGFAHFETSDLQNLGVGEAIVRVNRSDDDFNLRTFLPSEINSEEAQRNKEEVIKLSRDKYGRPSISFEGTPKEPKIVTPEPGKLAITENLNYSKIDELKVCEENIEKKNISFHRYLQSLIKRMAEQRGYKATIEEPTLDGSGRVDVGLEKNGEKMACEISVTTSENHELDNIKKCLRNGYHTILVCVQSKKNIDLLQSIVDKNLTGSEKEMIHIHQPDDLYTFFEGLDIKEKIPNTATAVKGYRVKLKYNIVSDMQKKQKRETISEIITHSLNKIKK